MQNQPAEEVESWAESVGGGGATLVSSANQKRRVGVQYSPPILCVCGGG